MRFVGCLLLFCGAVSATTGAMADQAAAQAGLADPGLDYSGLDYSGLDGTRFASEFWWAIGFVVGGLALVALLLRSFVREDAVAAFGSSRLVLGGGAALVVFLGGTVFLTLNTLDVLENQTRQQIATNLEASLNGRHAHLRAWVADQVNRAEMVTTTPVVAAALRDIAEGEVIAETRLRSALGRLGIDGIAFVDADGVERLNWVESPDGAPLDWQDAHGDRIARVLAGEPTLFPAIHKKVKPATGDASAANQSRARRLSDGTVHRTFVGVPFTLWPSGRTGAVIVNSPDAQSFNRILEFGRLFQTGETYAFDRRGWLLTESRFSRELVEMGLIPEAGREIRGLKVTDRKSVV